MKTVINIATIITCILLSISYSITAQINYEDPDRVAIPSYINQNSDLFKNGYLSVIEFGAIPNDQFDDTDEIQEAINAARDNKMVCYFPHGTYLVSNTLNCMMDTYVINGKHYRDRNEPVVIVGETSGNNSVQRPLIRVIDSNFDSGNPKPVFWFWASPANNCQQNGCVPGSSNPEEFESGVNFNQVIRGIDIDLNKKPMAIGIHHGGDQGSSVEDVTITATDAYAGVRGHGGGAAGGMFNVEIIGGQYGTIFKNYFSNYPLIVGCQFLDQEKQVLHVEQSTHNPFHSVHLAGFKIRMKTAESLNSFLSWNGGLSMVDGSIEVDTQTPKEYIFKIFNEAQSLYLSNVYVKNANHLTRNSSGNLAGELPPSPTGWNLVREYLHIGHFDNDGKPDDRNLIDCNVDNSDILTIEPTSFNNNDDLVNKHLWNENTYPSMNKNGNFINVKTGQNPAMGNGTTDDSNALQNAIDNFQYVFLPKGKYLITKPLVLGPNTQFFGAGKVFTQILISKDWNTTSEDGIPVITTQNNASATTSLSYISILAPKTQELNKTSISWQAGQNSFVRDINIGVYDDTDIDNYRYFQLPLSNSNFNIMEVKNNGGGKWYVAPIEFTRYAPATGSNVRTFMVENTTQNLNLYGLNVERNFGSPQAEFNNADNVNVHYFKAEAGGDNNTYPESTPLAIKNSSNINIYNGSGNVETPQNAGFVEIDRWSHGILISNIETLREEDSQGANVLEICPDGSTNSVAATIPVGVYKRACRVAGIPCDDGDPDTENDVEDGNCNCAGTPIQDENCNLVTNGNFDNGSTDWLIYNHAVASSNFSVNNENAYIDINNPSNKNWHIQLIHRDIPLEQKTYSISFHARANWARPIVFNWAENGGSYEIYHQETANLTTNWQTFNYTFNSDETDLNARIVFFLGLQSADVYLDNVAIRAANCVPDNCELVSNGDFHNGSTNWLTYDHGSASSTWNFNNSIAHASINNTGTARWHIQLIRRNIALEQGKTYNIIIRARASAARKIDFRWQEQGGNYTTYYREMLDLTTNWQTYNFTFTSTDTDPDARIVFFLGVESADVYFDDISISELNCTGNRVAQNFDADITIFPNPTSGEISIKYAIESPNEKGHIRVFDVWGRQVHETTFEASSQGLVTLDLNGLASGHYFLQFQTGQYISGHKIVVF